MLSRSFVLMAVLGLTFVASQASASVIWDSSPSDGTSFTGISSQTAADDFTLDVPTTITAIHFWALVNGDLALGDSFGGTIGWAIHEDANGLPGDIKESGTYSVDLATDLTPNGTHSLNVPEYIVAVDVTPDVTLLAGTYWLQLREGPIGSDSDGSELHWSYAVSGQGNAVFADESRFDPDETEPVWSSIASADLAFQLHGSVVPEPGSIVLLGMSGLMLLSTRRWKAHD